MHIYVKKNNIIIDNYKAKCAIGKRGISNYKIEGDLKTPKGSFKLECVYFRKDRINNIKTVLKKRIIKRNMGWCNDSRSTKYNQLVTLPTKFSAENLYMKRNIYNIIVVISYNRKKIQKNKGSAIFLHLADKKLSPTEGCVAVKKLTMLKILKLVNKNSKIIIN